MSPAEYLTCSKYIQVHKKYKTIISTIHNLRWKRQAGNAYALNQASVFAGIFTNGCNDSAISAKTVKALKMPAQRTSFVLIRKAFRVLSVRKA
jgi:hypothetical protein